jgi:transcriptional regulator with XRE-family HTH domain
MPPRRRVRPKKRVHRPGSNRVEAQTLLAARIQTRLEKLNWTNDELAKRIGRHKQQVSRYTIGTVTPSTIVLAEIAVALGVTMEWLLKGTLAEIEEGQGTR